MKDMPREPDPEEVKRKLEERMKRRQEMLTEQERTKKKEDAEREKLLVTNRPKNIL